LMVLPSHLLELTLENEEEENEPPNVELEAAEEQLNHTVAEVENEEAENAEEGANGGASHGSRLMRCYSVNT
ncbi:hypothetical protein, partial [Serratia marcescens]|uniref:hypothetical protein n=1 Tax=Serratia marcescens TaxID=615 RepID=UPI0019535986